MPVSYNANPLSAVPERVRTSTLLADPTTPTQMLTSGSSPATNPNTPRAPSKPSPRSLDDMQALQTLEADLADLVAKKATVHKELGEFDASVPAKLKEIEKLKRGLNATQRGEAGREWKAMLTELAEQFTGEATTDADGEVRSRATRDQSVSDRDVIVVKNARTRKEDQALSGRKITPSRKALEIEEDNIEHQTTQKKRKTSGGRKGRKNAGETPGVSARTSRDGPVLIDA